MTDQTRLPGDDDELQARIDSLRKKREEIISKPDHDRTTLYFEVLLPLNEALKLQSGRAKPKT